MKRRSSSCPSLIGDLIPPVRVLCGAWGEGFRAREVRRAFLASSRLAHAHHPRLPSTRLPRLSGDLRALGTAPSTASADSHPSCRGLSIAEFALLQCWT